MKSNKSMLNIIFESSVDELARITPEDEVFRASHPASITQEQIEAYIRSGNIDSDILISMLNELLDCFYFENGYFQEKYYKQGLADGINLLSDSKKVVLLFYKNLLIIL